MATKYGGYMGRILQIDLTDETVAEYPFTDRQRAETLGGKALAYHILCEQLTGREKAFSEENLLILSTGPLTGTGVPGSARFEVTAISPKTGGPVSSNCGGSFGVFLKKAGYDALILSGRCKAQSWLEIREDQVLFHDGNSLWGLTTSECGKQLQTQLPDTNFASLCVGPAGEDLLLSATILSGGHAAGRSGLGAVLGWKKLKAITVSGRKSIPVHSREKSRLEISKWNAAIKAHPLTSDPEMISACPGCPIRCKKPRGNRNPIWNDLGLDSMDTAESIQWMKEKLGDSPKPSSDHKSGQRRGGIYQKMLLSLGLAHSMETAILYQDLTEAISASGCCMFTLSSCCPTSSRKAKDTRWLLKYRNWFPVSIVHTRTLRSITGMPMDLRHFLMIGKRSNKLEQKLNDLFGVQTKLPKHLLDLPAEDHRKAHRR